MSEDRHTRKARQNAAMDRLSRSKRPRQPFEHSNSINQNNTRKPRSGIPRKQQPHQKQVKTQLGKKSSPVAGAVLKENKENKVTNTIRGGGGGIEPPNTAKLDGPVVRTRRDNTRETLQALETASTVLEKKMQSLNATLERSEATLERLSAKPQPSPNQEQTAALVDPAAVARGTPADSRVETASTRIEVIMRNLREQLSSSPNQEQTAALVDPAAVAQDTPADSRVEVANEKIPEDTRVAVAEENQALQADNTPGGKIAPAERPRGHVKSIKEAPYYGLEEMATGAGLLDDGEPIDDGKPKVGEAPCMNVIRLEDLQCPDSNMPRESAVENKESDPLFEERIKVIQAEQQENADRQNRARVEQNLPQELRDLLNKEGSSPGESTRTALKAEIDRLSESSEPSDKIPAQVLNDHQSNIDDDLGSSAPSPKPGG